ncbi:MAG: PEP-CTERM sorting domain-containing protein [Crocosphaera sp.]
MVKNCSLIKPVFAGATILFSSLGVQFNALAVPPDPPHDPPLPLPISFTVNGVTSPTPNVAEGINTFPNDVLDLFGLGVPTEGEIFQSAGFPLGAPPNTTNIDRMSASLGIGRVAGGACTGNFFLTLPEPCFTNPAIHAGFGPGSFGLTPVDNVISLSYGKDSGNVLQFSVDPEADGLVGTDVYFESTVSPHDIPDSFVGDEAAGDIYKSIEFAMIGSYVAEHIAADQIIKPASPNLNELYRDELELGLHAPGEEVDSPTQPFEDDLDGFEEADTGDPFWGVDIVDESVDPAVPGIDGAVDSPRTDPSDFSDSEKNAFFSLDALSGSIGLTTIAQGGPIPVYTPSGDTDVSADDILVSPGPGFFGIYANGVADIDLLPGDVLDALVLSDERPGINIPNGFLDPGVDEALFSLQAGSPTLALLNLQPGDVFYTNFSQTFEETGGRKFGLYADNLDIGLDNDDELNALDIKPYVAVPEPSSAISLLALGLLGLGSSRKLRKNLQSSEKENT